MRSGEPDTPFRGRIYSLSPRAHARLAPHMRWLIVIIILSAACKTEARQRAEQEQQVRQLEQSAKELRELGDKMTKDMEELKRKTDADLAPMKREADAWDKYGSRSAELENRMIEAQTAAIDARTPGERKALQAKADALKAERDRVLASWREASRDPAPAQPAAR